MKIWIMIQKIYMNFWIRRWKVGYGLSKTHNNPHPVLCHPKINLLNNNLF